MTQGGSLMMNFSNVKDVLPKLPEPIIDTRRIKESFPSFKSLPKHGQQHMNEISKTLTNLKLKPNSVKKGFNNLRFKF